MENPSTIPGITKENIMCVRCVDGWAEYHVNGEYITADFCDCDDGHALKAEMGTMWDELELHDVNLGG
jgi:hypothetical protein